jgi:hypothetical protein
MATMTLRGIDEKTAEALKERAQKERTSVKVRTCSIVPVSRKKSAHEGAGRDQAPRLSCSRQGRRFLCFLSFRRDKKKGRRGAGRSARGLDSIRR